MLMIGSLALVNKVGDIGREVSDKDYICSLEEFKRVLEVAKPNLKSFYPLSSTKWVLKYKEWAICEYEIATEGTSAQLMLDKYSEGSGEIVIAPLNLLYTIKMSHRFKKNTPHFLKTMDDIWLMESHGAEITDDLKEIYKLRQEESYSYKHPRLNKVTKKKFFTDSVDYTYDHDTLHEAFKIGDKPAYTLYLKDGEQVECDKVKWYKLGYETKLAGVTEEAVVLAFERSVIPFNTDPLKAFDMALEKVCTSITSGWFREFAWRNYKAARQLFMLENNKNPFQKRFDKALESGIIQPYSSD